MSESDRKVLLNDLLVRNERRIIAIARSYAAPSDVPDLIQEILLQIGARLEQFRGQASIDTWTYRIAGSNVALTWKRSNRRRQRWLPSEAVDPDLLGVDHADWNEAERLLQEFLTTLGEVNRAVLLLFLDNMNPDKYQKPLG